MAGKIRAPREPRSFRRTPIAMACAMAMSGYCLAQTAEFPPSPAPNMTHQPTAPLTIAKLSPREEQALASPRAGFPAAPAPAGPTPILRMALELAPALKIAGYSPGGEEAPFSLQSAAPRLQPDVGPAPVLRMARALTKAETADAQPGISRAAAPRPGSGESALSASMPRYAPERRRQPLPAPGNAVLADRPGAGTTAFAEATPDAPGAATKAAIEPVQVAQAATAAASTQVAAAAAPRPGQEDSALITGPLPDAPRPRRNRASATANLDAQVAPVPTVDAEAKEAGGTGFSAWKIPPILWGGDLAFNLSTNQSQGAPSNTQVYESLGLRAESYVFQPWFARVSGGLRATLANEGLGRRLASGHNGSSGLSGNASLALFPVSRFPFTASYDLSDSRTSGELVSGGYTSRRLSLTQSYAPATGNANYRLSFERSGIDSDLSGSDVASALVGTMSDRRGFHAYNLGLDHYDNAQGTTGNFSNFDRINASHSYRPNSTFSLDNMVNLGSSNYHLSSNGSATDNRNRYLQLNSFSTWRPHENSPLQLTGGARLFESRSTAAGAETDARTLSANAAASYTLNRNIMLSGSGTVTQASSADRSATMTSASAGANYNADPLRFGEYGYSRYANAYATRQGGSDRASLSTVSARIGHSLNRSFSLAENSNLQLNASQSFAKSSGTAANQTLVHAGGASWSLRPSASSSTLLALSASDSLSTGTAPSQHFQMVNLQGSGQVQLGRYASGGANMTIQGTRQSANTYSNLGTPATPGSGFNWTTNGSLNFQHARAFGVPRLRYTALFNVNQYQNRTRFEGDINAPIVRFNNALEQRFDYNIGRTELQLLMRYAEMEGRSNSMVFFRLTRRFGAY